MPLLSHSLDFAFTSAKISERLASSKLSSLTISCTGEEQQQQQRPCFITQPLSFSMLFCIGWPIVGSTIGVISLCNPLYSQSWWKGNTSVCSPSSGVGRLGAVFGAFMKSTGEATKVTFALEHFTLLDCEASIHPRGLRSSCCLRF